MKILSIVVLAIAAVFLTTGAIPEAAPPASEGVVHLVLSQALPSQPGTDVRVLTVDYPPGGSTPPHEHPGYTYAYVLQGKVVSQVDAHKTETYKAGEMWIETPHEHHMVSKNASASEPARLLVFLLAPHGAPLTTFLGHKP